MTALDEGLRELIRGVVREEIAKVRAEAKPDEYLTSTEAAALAKVAQGTIRRWIREGRLVAGVAGTNGKLRVRRSALESLLRTGRHRNASDDLTNREIDAMVERDFG